MLDLLECVKHLFLRTIQRLTEFSQATMFATCLLATAYVNQSQFRLIFDSPSAHSPVITSDAKLVAQMSIAPVVPMNIVYRSLIHFRADTANFPRFDDM